MYFLCPDCREKKNSNFLREHRMLKSKEGVIAPARSWATFQHTEKKTGRCDFLGGCNCNLYFSKILIFHQVTVHSYFPTLVRFSLKPAKQKVEVLGMCHCTSNIHRHLPTHRKNLQVAATVWGDAIVIFSPINLRFSQAERRSVAPFTLMAI